MRSGGRRQPGSSRPALFFFPDEHFSALGSTQNRSTTWQPHHTLHRPPTPLALTQSHLVAAGAHLGHSPSLTHRAALPLIYGTRSSLSYIDLRQTLPALRRAAQVVRGVVERDGLVVFVGSLKGAERAVWENAKRLGENGYGVTKWLPGSISNAKEVFGWSEIPEVEGEWRKGKASPLDFKPSLLVLLSPTLNQHALREATANEIPTIGICDTDVDPRCVTYSIPANDDSPRAIELIAGVLGMAGKDGLERKLARCVFLPAAPAPPRPYPDFIVALSRQAEMEASQAHRFHAERSERLAGRNY